MSDRIERARCRIAGFNAKPAECLIDTEIDGVRHEQTF
jgi:hypothetical protein